jgi:hypothetical protein
MRVSREMTGHNRFGLLLASVQGVTLEQKFLQNCKKVLDYGAE